MAETTLKKNAKGYSYKYTDIAEIHEWLESKGFSYYQYIDTLDGNDYIMTVPIIDGKEKSPRRGCKVIIGALQGKSNPAQEQGSGITYARRYSLLMAFGLATTDDDAQCMTKEEPKSAPTKKEMKDVGQQVIPESKIKALMKKAEDDGVSIVTILDKCKKPNLESLSEKQFNWVVANWSKEFKGGN